MVGPMADWLADGRDHHGAVDREPFAETTFVDGLRLREGLAFSEWVRLGTRLAQLSHASAWYLGDWLRYGERTYGCRYKTALETTCFDYQTLRNYAWVAGRFPPGRRLTGVSFQHHAEVASLPEPSQDLWLHRAERHRWSRNELRRQLRGAAHAGEDDEQSRLVVHIHVLVDREHRWREAAAAASQDLPEWLMQAGDEAADRALITSRNDVSEPVRTLAGIARDDRQSRHPVP